MGQENGRMPCSRCLRVCQLARWPRLGALLASSVGTPSPMHRNVNARER